MLGEIVHSNTDITDFDRLYLLSYPSKLKQTVVIEYTYRNDIEHFVIGNTSQVFLNQKKINDFVIKRSQKFQVPATFILLNVTYSTSCGDVVMINVSI